LTLKVLKFLTELKKLGLKFLNLFFSLLEFLIPISITSRGTTEEKLEMAFRMFDIDQNNYIDKKEMEKLITIIYELTGETDRTGMNDPVIKVIQVMNKLGIVYFLKFLITWNNFIYLLKQMLIMMV
jgi:Ca2+-binding EF-hand superfamily protein